MVSAAGVCAFCAKPATVTDWGPHLPWLAVEGCACWGFFVWTGLLAARLPSLSPDERGDLSRGIRKFRAMGHEVWVTTTTGAATGPLVIRTERPGRPMSPAPGPRAAAALGTRAGTP
jgi:hypothetical protein